MYPSECQHRRVLYIHTWAIVTRFFVCSVARGPPPVCGVDRLDVCQPTLSQPPTTETSAGTVAHLSFAGPCVSHSSGLIPSPYYCKVQSIYLQDLPGRRKERGRAKTTNLKSRAACDPWARELCKTDLPHTHPVCTKCFPPDHDRTQAPLLGIPLGPICFGIFYTCQIISMYVCMYIPTHQKK
ncbi:hypothetical protein GGS24DRAFT_247585 [Hypoxylon argillaceum]|nr:hypothetical protein GGS24DRAFT_247585 [Hypoxylon argillaceum]